MAGGGGRRDAYCRRFAGLPGRAHDRTRESRQGNAGMMRIVLLVALLVAALPARAMFGFGPVQTYYHWGDAYDPAESGQTQVVLVRDVNNDGLDDVLLAHNDYASPTYGLYLLVF